jgi:hypothetical protein
MELWQQTFLDGARPEVKRERLVFASAGST